ncbi:general substrate transporter [Hysterangium stoloniferum]|nr:general substrate transporter [Hysterangium stoloniferum]
MATLSNKKAVIFCFFVAFGGFLFGYDIGVISGCLIMEDFNNRFGDIKNADGTRTLSASRQSIITSLLSAGGALAQALTTDRFGRKKSILIWTIIFTIGVAIQTGTVNSVAQITFGRFVAGLGVGALSAIVPLYNGEAAPKKIRGALLVLYQLQIITGIFLSYIFDLATHNIKNTASWKVPIGLQLVWGLILIGGIMFLPESPRHLLYLGRETEARAALSELNGVPEDDPLIQEIVEELQLGIREENEGGKATWIECFSTRNQLWKRTGNGMMISDYYGDTFFKSAGTTLSPYVIQTILGGVSLIGTVPALYLIETVGRRQSLLIGSVLEGLCSLIAGLVGHFTLAPAGTALDLLTRRNKQGGDTLIAFAVLHVFSFSMFWGPTPWVYLGESFPLRVRAKSIALGSATNWIWNFLLSFFAPRIANDIGPLILLIFFGMLTFGYVYVYLFVPETKGLTLEEVDEMYRARIAPWRSVYWKPSGRLHVRHATDEKNGAADAVEDESSKE